VCGVNEVFEAGDDDEGRHRLTYVALTRATDELVITVSGSGPIGDALVRAQ
jgi:superfamily I DNA/RNA helicase